MSTKDLEAIEKYIKEYEKTRPKIKTDAQNRPEPFSVTYRCFEELRDEMRTAAERYLPKGFDRDLHIGYVTYTILNNQTHLTKDCMTSRGGDNIWDFSISLKSTNTKQRSTA